MQNKEYIQAIRVDGYTRLCLSAIAVLLTVLVLGLWSQSAPLAGPADAAEPFLDSSAQRLAMVKAQEQTNAKLDELISLLKSGEAKVQVVDAKKEGDHGPSSNKGN